MFFTDKKKYFIYFFIIILTGVVLGDLFKSGLPITHDGQDHVARIANFYKNLEEGVLIPRWAGNLNWGYGHPVLMFLYPFPSYLASFFHFVGFSFVDSVKAVFAVAFIASGVAMYLWIKNLYGFKAGFFAAMLYTFAPYRFVDMYVRGAIGEHVAFVFPPIILFALLKLSKHPAYSFLALGSITFALFILSHNAISLMFLPIIIAYASYLVFLSKKRKKLINFYLLILFLGFGLSAFFWVPAFMEGKYTLRDIVTGSSEYASRFVSIPSLFYGPWDYGGTGRFTTQIGIVQWVFSILALFATYELKKRKDEKWMVSAFLILVFVSSLFLMTRWSESIWQTITTLQKFQFPWRFLSVSVFATAVLGGFVVYSLPKRWQQYALVLGIVVLLFSQKEYWHAQAYLQKPESFYTNIYYGTTDTGESAPIWSVRFMEKTPNAHMEVLDGKATIKGIDRKITYHTYEITADSRTRLKENTLFFPGWRVYVDGQQVPIEFQDQRYQGIMTFFVDEGKHSVEIVFSETKLRLLANIISIGSLFILLGVGILVKRWPHFL